MEICILGVKIGSHSLVRRSTHDCGKDRERVREWSYLPNVHTHIGETAPVIAKAIEKESYATDGSCHRLKGIGGSK